MVCLGSLTIQGRLKTKLVPTMEDGFFVCTRLHPNPTRSRNREALLHTHLGQIQDIRANFFFLSGGLLKGCISLSVTHVTEGFQKIFKDKGPAAEIGPFFLQGQSLVRGSCQSRSDPCCQELHPLGGKLELSLDLWLLFMDLAILCLCCRKSKHSCFRNNVFWVWLYFYSDIQILMSVVCENSKCLSVFRNSAIDPSTPNCKAFIWLYSF